MCLSNLIINAETDIKNPAMSIYKVGAKFGAFSSK